MRRLTLCAAAVWALAGVCAPARAADKTLVAEVDKDLAVDGDHYDERAVLAALLARPAESAAFDADARASLSDPNLKALFFQKWRGKLAAFAATEAKVPDVDLTRTYANWTQIMSPEQRAYTAQRMLTMSADNRDKLVYYLKKLNDSLASNGGHIDTGMFSISKRIVAGVMEQYRNDLNAYVATPQAADGRAHGTTAAAELARDLAPHLTPAPETTVASAATTKPVQPKPAAKPAPLAPPASRPSPTPPPTPVPEISAADRTGAATSGALAQAQAAAHAGEGAAGVFDGGKAAAGTAAPVGGAPADLGAPVSLAPSNGAAPSGLTASVPPVPANGGDVDLMKQVEGMSSGRKPAFGWIKEVGAGLLGLLGGLIGFLVAGPVGAAIGAAVGAGAGYVAANALISRFT